MILPILTQRPLKLVAKRQRQADTIAQLKARNRSAAWVWLALINMGEAAGSAVVTPTRELLQELTGIPRLQTISAGLTALHDAGWIEVIHIPRQNEAGQRVTLLRIIIRKQRFSFSTVKSTVGNEKRSTGKHRKTFCDSLKRECVTTPRTRVVVTPSIGDGKALTNQIEIKAFSNADGVPIAVAEMQAKMRDSHAGGKK